MQSPNVSSCKATEEESYTSTVVNSTDSEDDVEIYDSTGNLLSTSIVFKDEVYTYNFSFIHCFGSRKMII